MTRLTSGDDQLYWKDAVYSAFGCLDSRCWAWSEAVAPEDAEPIEPRDALRRVADAGPLYHLPVGVIGPRDATPSQNALAQRIGQLIAEAGLPLVCGGKSGVMEASAKGAAEAGGLTIGLLPGHSWREANAYIQLPLATGLSEARNMIIAKSCQVLIAIGGSYGTLSEIAYGLHFSKAVIVLDDAYGIEGVMAATDADDAMKLTALALFRAASTP
ncbi:MAG: TIGR00725 family protein [Pseudomonadota bacterium]